MTVAELIAKLQAMPQDAVALCYEDRYGYIDVDPEIDTVWRDDNYGYTSYQGSSGMAHVTNRIETQVVVL